MDRDKLQKVSEAMAEIEFSSDLTIEETLELVKMWAAAQIFVASRENLLPVAILTAAFNDGVKEGVARLVATYGK